MGVSLRKTRVLATAAAAVALGVSGIAGAMSAQGTTTALTNVGFSQLQSVDAGQLNYPVQIHWSNPGGASSIYIYRNQGSSTLIGQANGTTKTWYDVLSLNGTNAAYGSWTYYALYAYDANGNYLGEYDTSQFVPEAQDDASGNVTFSNGTWYRKSQTGATKGHYTYSSSPGAKATFGDCWYNIGLVATTGPTGGKANIVQNGVIVKQVSFYSATVKKRVLLWKTGYPTYQCTTVSLVQTSGTINVDTVQEFVD
jgi:hypothetical protein